VNEVVQGRAPAPEDIRPRRAAFPRLRSAESRHPAAGSCRPAVFERTSWRTRASVTCPQRRVSFRATRSGGEGETRPSVRTQLARGRRSLWFPDMNFMHMINARCQGCSVGFAQASDQAQPRAGCKELRLQTCLRKQQKPEIQPESVRSTSFCSAQLTVCTAYCSA
jgi:hypothetical protein